MKQQALEKKGAGVNPQSQIHYIDHLAIVCILMDIPLLFTDPNHLNLALRYYPGLKAEFIDFQEMSPEYLISHYDVLFLSDLWDRNTFHEKFSSLEQKYKKTLRHVHCPHGFSDKGFYLMKTANEDIALIYGQNMLDQLEYHHVLKDLKNYVVVGNYRYSFFKQNTQFYKTLVEKEVMSCFAKKQSTILYAPTWMDLEESSTFFDAYSHILGNLPDDYNLIVKLHPRLELDDTGKYYQIVGQYEKKTNVLFLKDFPLIYPLLAITDIYLGDMSSIGYDFLPFDKPMFFLNKQKRDPNTDRGLYLFRCGVEIKPESYSKLYSLIQMHLKDDTQKFSEIRQKVYNYTFAKEKSFEEMKKEIIAAYNKPLEL